MALAPALMGWFATRQMRKTPWRRFFLTSAVVATFEVTGCFLYDFHFGFRMVSFLLYGNCITIPALIIYDTVRHWRSIGAHHNILAILSILALLTVAYALFIETDKIEARQEELLMSQWQSGRPLRIAHVTDLQTVGYTERESIAVGMVNEFQPDLVIFTGDYIAGPFEDDRPAIEAARRFLKALKPKLGTVVLDGHSENESRRAQVFAGLDIIHLRNSERTFALDDGREVRVVGLDVHRPNISLVNGPKKANQLLVVASHVPDVTKELTGQGVDLHLAGHTHGGQIVIPGFGPLITLSELPREYARGLKKYEDHMINVCAGIGTEGDLAPRLRLFCPPEVTLIKIQSGNLPQ